jgi:hypothetical protein
VLTIRVLIVLAPIAMAVLAVSAAAQDAQPPAGRFQLSPGDGSGFVRLDTRTGSVAHCRQDAGVWRCEPILDSGLSDRLSALSDKVDRLSSDLGNLSLRVDTLAAGAGAPPVAPVAGDKAGREPAGFAQTALHRLLEVIRTLKHGRADAT